MVELHIENSLYIPSDIISSICSWLSDKNKINLLSITTQTHLLKNQILYCDQIKIKKIGHLWYLDQFTRIIINNFDAFIPVENINSKYSGVKFLFAFPLNITYFNIRTQI